MTLPAPVAHGVFCRTCEKTTSWVRAGVEGEGRLLVVTYRCRSCSVVRVQLADVTDAEALCANILEAWRRGKGRGNERFDADDALGHLREQLWIAYREWDGRGTFLGFGTYRLRLRFNDWFRSWLGKEDHPRPLAVALSLDMPIVTANDATLLDVIAVGGSVGGAYGPLAVDDSARSAAHLAGVLSARSGAIARQDRELDTGTAPATAA